MEHAEVIALHRRSSFYVLIIAIAVVAIPRRASAARAIVHVEGAGATAVSVEIRDALPPGTTAEPRKPFETALSRGAHAAVGRAQLSDKQLGATAERIERALAQSGADVAIVVHAARAQRGQRSLRVLVVARGQAAGFFSRTIKETTSASRADRVKRWAELLADALAQTPPGSTSGVASSAGAAVPARVPETQPAVAGPIGLVAGSAPPGAPAPPTPEPASDTESASQAENAMTPTSRALMQGVARRQDWRLTAAFETSYRRFEDSGPNTGIGRSYEALPVPGFSVGAEAYPIAGGRVGFAAAYARSIGVHSTVNDGRVVGTTWNRIEGSGRIRFPTAQRDNPPWVGAFVGYGYSGFSFDGGPSEREIPQGEYHMARAGVDARVPVDRVVAIAGLEAGWLFRIAPLGDVAVRGTGGALSARIGFGYQVTRALLVRVDGRYARMFFALEREGGSVVDQYFTGGIGIEAGF